MTSLPSRVIVGNPTPFPELNDVLRELVAGVQAALGETFVAACLQGSFAVGGFDQHSDVDFVLATRHEVSVEDVAKLQALHGRIYDLDSEWARHLEGSYFLKDVLANCEQREKLLWYLGHGQRSLVRSTHCNTAVVRWVVRERGGCLAGVHPAALIDPVPVGVLRAEILATIVDWGNEILTNPGPFNSRFYQSFIVLSYCRMLRDMVRGRVASKREGADWAKTVLDSHWHGLVDRAWNGRPDPSVSSWEPADAAEVAKTLDFVKHVIKESQACAALGPHNSSALKEPHPEDARRSCSSDRKR